MRRSRVTPDGRASSGAAAPAAGTGLTASPSSFSSSSSSGALPHTRGAAAAPAAGPPPGAPPSTSSSTPAAAPPAAPAASGELGLTQNQCRLLYLVSLYTRPARRGGDKEEWVRQQALMVLLYEGIVAGVLDYDYAPAASLVGNRRVFFNKSQEGASDVDFLREEGLLHGLKLSSTHYNPVTCYQVSEAGQALAARVPAGDKAAVQGVAFAPGSRELLRVQWHRGAFLLVGAGGYQRRSTVLDCEAVSYVGSAYIPQCLRFGGRPTLSNAHRAAECALAASTVRDTLDEVVTLNSVSIIVAEFIPCGANQLVAMNATLGTAERVAGGFFTALQDADSGGTQFVVDPGLTSVAILDHSPTRHVNFEATIRIPEGKGVTQVETFGVSVNSDGTLFYGMQVEAVMDRVKDNISLDTLARLLVDVAADSSTVVDSVLSPYQRRLLSLVFDGDAPARDKCNLIVANEITPHLTAEEFMDRGEYENELRQVIGDTRAAFDVSEHDTLVFGAHGLLLAGPNARQHEPLLVSYLQFAALDLFTRSFFGRLHVLADAQAQLRLAVNAHAEDPTSVGRVQARLQALADDVRLMGEALGYMAESLEGCELPPEPTDAAGRALYARLQVADVAGQLSARVLDLRKNLEGLRQELAHLRHLATLVFEARQLAVHEATQHSTQRLVSLHETQERVAATLRLILAALAGLLAFAVLDRLTGSWTVMDTAWFEDFAKPMIRNSPLLWFLVSMAVWACVAGLAGRALALAAYTSQGGVTVRVRVMRRLMLDRFAVYLASKATSAEERVYDGGNALVRQSWVEAGRAAEFGGAPPTVTVEYDRATGFMHAVTLQFSRRAGKRSRMLTASEVRNKVADDMAGAEIWEERGFTFREDPPPPPPGAAGQPGDAVAVAVAPAKGGAGAAGGKKKAR